MFLANQFMESNTVDFISIGSGPISIFEALHQEAKGKSVLLIDQSSSIGGAWRTTNIEGIGELEIGCHIWSLDKASFEFIRSTLDIHLLPLKPQPYLIKGGKRISYDWKTNIITLRRFFSNLKSLNWKRMQLDWKSPMYRLSLFPSKYLYPSRGATEFIEALQKRIDDSKLSFRMNEEVQKAIVSDDSCQLELKSGEEISGKELIITRLSNLQSIEWKGAKIKPEYRQFDYVHVHLVLSNSEGRAFSYIRWMDDEMIHRISDITDQTKGTASFDKGKRVLIVGVHGHVYHDHEEEDLIDKIMTKLRSLKLIAASTALDHSQFNVFPSYYPGAETRGEIEAITSKNLSVLPSTDLIYAIHAQLPRWRETLQP